jgi:hypothetical protein
VLPGLDYRYGFPVDPRAIAVLERLGDPERGELLAQLEAAAFEALVGLDLDNLPVRALPS